MSVDRCELILLAIDNLFAIKQSIYTLKLVENDGHFVHNSTKCIFMTKDYCILIRTELNFVKITVNHHHSGFDCSTYWVMLSLTGKFIEPCVITLFKPICFTECHYVLFEFTRYFIVHLLGCKPTQSFRHTCFICNL